MAVFERAFGMDRYLGVRLDDCLGWMGMDYGYGAGVLGGAICRVTLDGG